MSNIMYSMQLKIKQLYYNYKYPLEMTNEQVTKEILKCVGISAPGPHAILLVVRVGRFTKEERETVNLLQKAFGENLMKYLIVVFTGKDDLDRDTKTVQEMVQNAPLSLQQFLADCGNRYLALNNHDNIFEKNKQVREIIEKTENVVCTNGGSYYQSVIFNEVEKGIQERIKEKEREHEIEIARIREQMEEELRQRDREARIREEALQDQLRQLREQRKQQSIQMRYLRKSFDRENNQDIDTRILDVNDKLDEVQRERQTELVDLDDKMIEIRRGYNPREEVRDEIERGDDNIIKRMWDRVRKGGEELKERFASLFERLKQKAGFL